MRAPTLLPLLLLACAKVPLPPGPLGAVRDATAPLSRPEGVIEPTRPATPPRPRTPQERFAQAARDLVDGPFPSGFREDCSGFVCAAGQASGMALPSSTAALWELAERADAVHRRRDPALGDLAFFDDTWDRNRNHRLDDPLSHVGVVVGLLPDGTVEVAHVSSSKGRTLLHLNLHRPHDHADEEGRVLNDWLRVRTAKDPRGTRYLAGELWRGWATLPASAGR
ncbi:MAG: hypothetical protein H6732_17630 [Alphaproteobacteria bacterium]|nr:hypothetical protein [Alphaproteobacteria bacterium]